MTLHRYGFEGFADGTALVASTCLSDAGVAANQKSNTGTATVKYRTLNPHTGTSSLEIVLGSGDTGLVRLPFRASNTQVATTFNHFTAALPTSTDDTIAQLVDNAGAGARAGQVRISTTGQVKLLDKTLQTIATSAAGAYVAGVENRISIVATVGTTTTNGAMTVKCYQGTNGDGGTAAATVTSSAMNLGTVAIGFIDLGRSGAITQAITYYYDDARLDDGQSAEIGAYFPAANSAPTVTAGAAQTVAPGTAITFSFSATDDTAVASLTGAVTGPAAVTLSGTASGTSASASRTYAPTGTFTTPGIYTATATATDGSGATGTASTTVYVYPVSGAYADPVAVSGSWTNVGGAANLLAAISDTNTATYGEVAPGTPLFVTLAPQGPGALTIGVEGYWSVGTVSRTLTLYKADGTTQIDTVTYDPTNTDNEKLWAVSTTQTNSLIPAATDRQALILKIQDA